MLDYTKCYKLILSFHFTYRTLDPVFFPLLCHQGDAALCRWSNQGLWIRPAQSAVSVMRWLLLCIVKLTKIDWTMTWCNDQVSWRSSQSFTLLWWLTTYLNFVTFSHLNKSLVADGSFWSMKVWDRGFESWLIYFFSGIEVQKSEMWKRHSVSVRSGGSGW